MSKAADLAKTSTKAGFNYLWGLVISTIISSLGTIYIAILLGEAAYGLYGIVLTVPNLLFLFRDWGINNAIVRYTAQYKAENRATEIRSIFITGIIFEIAMGLILTLFSFFMAGYIADNILNRPIAPLIQIASFSILAGGLVSAAGSIFTGTEKTTYYSIMIICQSVIKTLLIVGLVMAGLGTTGAIVGFTASLIIAGLVGMIFTIILYRQLPQLPTYKLKIKEYFKEMIKYSAPLGILAILSGVLAQFYLMTLSHFHSDNVLIGNYALANTFIILISFFAVPINTLLFPAFSKLDIKKDQLTLKNVFQYSTKYSALIVVPVTTLVMCLSTPAVNTIFPGAYTLTPLFLTLLSISYLFAAIGNLSISNIINSQGQTSLNLKLTILTATIALPMGYFLIMHYNVFGLIFTSAVAPLPSLILSIVWVKKHYNLTIDWISSAKILLSSAITAALTYLLVTFIPLGDLTITLTISTYSIIIPHAAFTLTIGAVFYILVLLGVLILTKSLSIHDLNNLRSMTTGIGPITKILHLVLNNMEKIMKKLKLT